MQGVAGGTKPERPPLKRGPVHWKLCFRLQSRHARRRFGLRSRHRDGIKFNRKISIKFLIIFLKVQRLLGIIFLKYKDFWALFSKKCYETPLFLPKALGLLRAFPKSAPYCQLVFILRVMVRMVKVGDLYKAIDRLHLLIAQHRFARIVFIVHILLLVFDVG